MRYLLVLFVFLPLRPLVAQIDSARGWSKVDLPFTWETRGGISFINKNVGWLAADSLMYHTTDQGRTWLPIGPNRAPGQYMAPVFFDSLIGWSLASQYLLLRTTDGGMSWCDQNPSLPSGDGQFGFFSKDTAFAVSGTHVSRTYDGGATWDNRIVPTPGILNSICRLDSRTLIAVGNYSSSIDGAALIRSGDGGDTWEQVPNIHLPGSLQLVVSLDDSTVLATAGTRLYISTDRGASWPHIDLNGRYGLRAASFPDRQHGYLVGDVGQIFVTSDGGLSWLTEESGTLADLVHVAFTDSVTGYITTSNGMLLTTRNAGRAWLPRANLRNNILNAVCSPSPTHAEALVSYTLVSADQLTISLINSEGVSVRTMAPSGVQDIGTHNVRIDLSGLPSGAYTVRIAGAHANGTAKLTIVK